MMKDIAIILPVYQEASIIRTSLQHLCALGASKIIVVDGGSSDGTSEIVENEFPLVRLVRSDRAERAFQMNVGAFEAHANILLFVHADMRLPHDAISLILRAMDDGFVGGGFVKRFDCETLLLCLARMMTNALYLGLMRSMVGSNAIFVSGDVFKKINGFPEVPILEDVIFSRKLKKEGQIAKIARPVIVSSRRYLKHGVVNQMLKNALILFKFKWFHEDLFILKEVYDENFQQRK